jgi:hypothetical protein
MKIAIHYKIPAPSRLILMIPSDVEYAHFYQFYNKLNTWWTVAFNRTHSSRIQEHAFFFMIPIRARHHCAEWTAHPQSENSLVYQNDLDSTEAKPHKSETSYRIRSLRRSQLTPIQPLQDGWQKGNAPKFSYDITKRGRGERRDLTHHGRLSRQLAWEARRRRGAAGRGRQCGGARSPWAREEDAAHVVWVWPGEGPRGAGRW